MRLSTLLDETHIQVKLHVSSKKALFEAIADHISASHPLLNPDQLVANLSQRERLGGTGIGNGVAIPHCRVPRNSKCILGFYTLAEPIFYDDENPAVELVALLLAPESADQQHLDLLAEVAALVQTQAVRSALIQAQSATTLLEVVQTHASAAPSRHVIG